MADDATALTSRRCTGKLRAVRLGTNRVRERMSCGGLWTATTPPLSIAPTRERQAAVITTSILDALRLESARREGGRDFDQRLREVMGQIREYPKVLGPSR